MISLVHLELKYVFVVFDEIIGSMCAWEEQIFIRSNMMLITKFVIYYIHYHCGCLLRLSACFDGNIKSKYSSLKYMNSKYHVERTLSAAYCGQRNLP